MSVSLSNLLGVPTSPSRGAPPAFGADGGPSTGGSPASDSLTQLLGPTLAGIPDSPPARLTADSLSLTSLLGPTLAGIPDRPPVPAPKPAPNPVKALAAPPPPPGPAPTAGPLPRWSVPGMTAAAATVPPIPAAPDLSVASTAPPSAAPATTTSGLAGPPAPGSAPHLAALDALSAIKRDADAAMDRARSAAPTTGSDFTAAARAAQAGLAAVQNDATGNSDATVAALGQLAAASVQMDGSQAAYLNMTSALTVLSQRAGAVAQPNDTVQAVAQAQQAAQQALDQEAKRLGAMDRNALSSAIQAKAAQLNADNTPVMGHFSRSKAAAMLADLNKVLTLDTTKPVATYDTLAAQVTALQAKAATAATSADAQQLAAQAQPLIQQLQAIGAQAASDCHTIDHLWGASGLPVLQGVQPVTDPGTQAPTTVPDAPPAPSQGQHWWNKLGINL